MRHRTRLAHWYNHVNAVDAPGHLRHWLTDPGSLTYKLKARCDTFAVRHLSQGMERCCREDSQALGMAGRGKVMQREVILLCDNQPVVYACSTVLSNAMRRDWPFLASLGSKPLGEKLFTDVRIARQPLQYARLDASHPAMLRATLALGVAQVAPTCHARRSVFCRHGGIMLVTEIFLPAITRL